MPPAMPVEHVQPGSETVPCTMRQLLLYFLRLGTFGFGGPIALAGYMQRDLVEERRWFSRQDYAEGLALSQLSPGPLAAQLAKYLGWVRGGVAGATLVGLAFIGPSFLMVITLSLLYVHYGGLAWIQAMFYGIGAAVIAIIARSAYKLARTTVGRDPLLIGLFALLVKAWRPSPAATASVVPFAWLFSGLHGPAAGELWRIAWYFTEAGA